MQAVRLAGGRGKRLGALTGNIPKPMLRIHHQPFLLYQFLWLKKFHIRNVLILAGYDAKKISAFFGDGSGFGLRISYSVESIPMGTAGALRNAGKFLKNPFLLLYGDSFLPADLCKLEKRYISSDARGIMTLYDNKERTGVANNVLLDDKGKIALYRKGSADPCMNHVEAGAGIYSRSILRFIPPGKDISLEETVFPALIRKRMIEPFVVRERFYDIGTPVRLKDFKSCMNRFFPEFQSSK